VGTETLGQGWMEAVFHCCWTVLVEVEILNKRINGL